MNAIAASGGRQYVVRVSALLALARASIERGRH
jgi:hypothetical protein